MQRGWVAHPHYMGGYTALVGGIPPTKKVYPHCARDIPCESHGPMGIPRANSHPSPGMRVKVSDDESRCRTMGSGVHRVSEYTESRPGFAIQLWLYLMLLCFVLSVFVCLCVCLLVSQCKLSSWSFLTLSPEEVQSPMAAMRVWPHPVGRFWHRNLCAVVPIRNACLGRAQQSASIWLYNRRSLGSKPRLQNMVTLMRMLAFLGPREASQ